MHKAFPIVPIMNRETTMDFMSNQLTVKNNITINAPTSKVWEILVKPQYVKQWDELPEDFGDDPLDMGREIVWRYEDGAYTKLSVTAFEVNKLLRLSLYNSSWVLPPESYNIAYTHLLMDQESYTLLTITIGDFAQLSDGRQYYEASLEFGSQAVEKIKELAENMR